MISDQVMIDFMCFIQRKIEMIASSISIFFNIVLLYHRFLYLKENLFSMFFNPINLSNPLKLHLPGIKGAIPTALLCIERCS